MPLMRPGVVALALGMTLYGTAAPTQAEEQGLSAQPVAYARPLAPDCRAMAARFGPQGLWFGAISGRRFDVFGDRSYPYYAEGCFRTEYACRRWLHENLTFMQGSLYWMRCQPGVPARAIY
jgi:hypothetical protein